MFTSRSQKKELIDLGPDYYTHDEYVDCLKKLFLVNKLLGFFRSTKKILKQFSKTSSLLDIGCGDGLFILHLSKIFPEMHMLGIDISVEAINTAEQSLKLWQHNHPDTHVSFKLQDQAQLNFFENKTDIILATLVCHHLSDEELIIFLRQMYLATHKTVIINDLHRHPLAYYLYGFISPILFRNRLITHDGLISIQRGFTRSEWKSLLKQAGINRYKLKWCFPFRWQLILWK
jgi:2-polyprenyl-3-methyl-5-hydroxy-6-metoxy-1,4-benzoquinol methylase